MLLLTRKRNEKLLIGDDIVIVFMGVGSHGEQKIGVSAPKNVRIMRAEISERYEDWTEDTVVRNSEESRNHAKLSTDSVDNSVGNSDESSAEYSEPSYRPLHKKIAIVYKSKIKRWESLSAQLGQTPESRHD